MRVDPNTIRFSMPTVAADEIELIVPSRQSFEGAPQFHEDEWRQVEFYPASRIDELKARLSEYKLFEQRHRTEYGWTEIYARRIAAPGVLQGPGAKEELAELLEATAQPSPILTTASAPLGQVKDGFTLRLADTVFLYGIAGTWGVESLAGIVEEGGDMACLAHAFIKLYQRHALVLIDWRRQMLLLSVNTEGKMELWQA